ncbi:MAG TPA: tetratricopeptide repeat protein [Steroidobacteraceae bacterium]|nr:tetratricopeptide repeat protein [Steroidobacteraceae bacterium]
MSIVKLIALLTALLACFVLPDSAALAAGGGSMDLPQTPRETRTPEDDARMSYNAGVKQLDKAKKQEQDAANATDESKRERALKKAQGAYEKAAREFEKAVSRVPELYEGWNYLGFARRHLGRYDAALEAYERALKLKPGYADALEYRGEAYLGLNRLDDARKAYMDLFASSRKHADQLLASMQKYVEARRKEPNGLATQQLDEFARWVDERAGIAQQTASLDTGSQASWR